MSKKDISKMEDITDHPKPNLDHIRFLANAALNSPFNEDVKTALKLILKELENESCRSSSL